MKGAAFFALSLALSVLIGSSLGEAQLRRKGPGKIGGRPAPGAMTPERTTPETLVPSTPEPKGDQPGKKAEILEELSEWEARAFEEEKKNDWQKASGSYSRAARAARLTGQLQQAITYANKALEFGKKADGPGLQASALFHLAFAYKVLRQDAKVIELLEEGIQAAKRMPAGIQKETLEGNLGKELGLVYLRQGKTREAIEHISSALQALDTRLLLLQSGRHQPHPNVIKHVQELVLSTLESLGRAHERAGNAPEAIKAYEQGLGIIRRSGLSTHLEANFSGGLGRFYLRQGDYPRALENLQEALQIAERQQHANFIYQASSQIADAYLQVQKPAEAIPYYKKAIENIESTRSLLESEEFRTSFFEDKGRIYGGMILAHVAAGNVEEAFNYNERARSRAFLDILGSRVQLGRGNLLAEERTLQTAISAIQAKMAEEQENEAQKQALSKELEAAQKTYTNFLGRVRTENKEQASLMSVEPLTLKQVQALLEPGHTLVEYFLPRGRAMLWVVDKDSVKFVKLTVSRSELISRVSSLRESIQRIEDKEKFTEVSQDLYRVLIEPALPHIKGKELVIIPHEALHYLPFQALLSPQGRYLIENYPIHYFSSASVMQFTREKRRARRESAFIMGNPSLGDQAYDLRFAEREAREVARIYPKSALFLRDQATKDKVISHGSKHDILHFAVHGELKEDDPLNSGLLLVGDNGKGDGRLKVGEIFSLNLQADIVVLSACETGLGKITSGDEIIGLTRAFIYAGTPSVITTLWKVNDRASYVLMREFYANLGTLKKSEALRQAQLKTMRQFPEPFFWAAYGLSGEP
ncbi:MAG: CHAT domain-containing protein [candidate division NC10 bacterium]|nr:CHAT domain-containing protein [candidate division NC10 bacterium]